MAGIAVGRGVQGLARCVGRRDGNVSVLVAWLLALCILALGSWLDERRRVNFWRGGTFLPATTAALPKNP